MFFDRKYILYIVLIFLSLSWLELHGQSQRQIFCENIIPKEQEKTNEELLKEAQPNTQAVRQVSFSDINDQYHSEEFNYNTESQSSTILSSISEIVQLIASLFYNKIADNSMKTFKRILYISLFLIGLFIAVKLIIRHKGRWLFDKSDQSLLLTDETPTDIHRINFKELIEKYENQNNTRQSIRLYYLWFLKILSDQNHIEWAPEKTNSDYFREMQNPNLKQKFAQLSHLYNHVWYGEFQIQDFDYQSAKSDFETYIYSK